jgi:integrase
MADARTPTRTRSANGEDTSFVLPSGKVKVQISLYDEDGVRRRRSKTIDPGSGIKGRTKQAKAELHAQYPDGKVHAPTAPGVETTVGDVLDQWSAHYLNDVAQSTADNYRTMARKHVKPGLDTTPLADLTTAKVNAWLRGMATETDDHRAYSRSTIKLARKVLSMALDHAKSERRVPENVARDAKIPNAETRETRSLTGPEIKRFLAAATGDRYEAAFLVQLALGLRIGEVLALTRDDVDGDHLHVRHSQRREGGELIARGAPKSESSKRILAMPEAVSEALWRQHVERRTDDEEASMGIYRNPTDLFFPDQLGGPTRPETYRRHLVAVYKKAKIIDATSHTLRHTCASTMVSAGVPLGTVSDLLGHADMAVLVRTYRHSTSAVVNGHVDAMAAVLASSS